MHSPITASIPLDPGTFLASIDQKIPSIFSEHLIEPVFSYLSPIDLIAATDLLALEAHFAQHPRVVRLISQIFRSRVIPFIRERALNFHEDPETGKLVTKKILMMSERRSLSGFFFSLRIFWESKDNENSYVYPGFLCHQFIENRSLDIFDQILRFPFAQKVFKRAFPIFGKNRVEEALKVGNLLPFLEIVVKHRILTPEITERILDLLREQPDLFKQAARLFFEAFLPPSAGARKELLSWEFTRQEWMKAQISLDPVLERVLALYLLFYPGEK